MNTLRAKYLNYRFSFNFYSSTKIVVEKYTKKISSNKPMSINSLVRNSIHAPRVLSTQASPVKSKIEFL